MCCQLWFTVTVLKLLQQSSVYEQGLSLFKKSDVWCRLVNASSTKIFFPLSSPLFRVWQNWIKLEPSPIFWSRAVTSSNFRKQRDRWPTMDTVTETYASKLLICRGGSLAQWLAQLFLDLALNLGLNPSIPFFPRLIRGNWTVAWKCWSNPSSTG